ncbi:DUF4118 domain-containing protein [Streptomyces sp. NBC_01483]|uniref:DUF4118 domain-containing protein n=1 Tax=Streptomyces sp. NBC_01483 TaxID=2903883 RepID=UPI002E314B13|nr:DUF4118 domain-containing protein [Streptomyces sp. NBC_01483]
MTGYSLRDRLALVAGLVGPFLVALVLVPFRTDLSRTNAALILVVVVVAVAALGSRTAGALAALSAAVWFDFFLTRPYETFDIRASADIETAVLLLVVGVFVSHGHRRWDVDGGGWPAGRPTRSNCAPPATATTWAASCSPPARAPYPRSRPVWWRSPSPTRRARPSTRPGR